MDKATDTYVRKEDTRIPNMSDEIKKKWTHQVTSDTCPRRVSARHEDFNSVEVYAVHR